MAGTSLAAFQDHLKLARDYALEGVYDTSIIFFDGAIAQIIKYSLSLCVPPLLSLYVYMCRFGRNAHVSSLSLGLCLCLSYAAD